MVEVDHGGAVYAPEKFGVQSVFHFFHGAAQNVHLALGVHAHVISRGLNPFDGFCLDPHRALPL